MQGINQRFQPAIRVVEKQIENKKISLIINEHRWSKNIVRHVLNFYLYKKKVCYHLFYSMV